MLDYQADLLRKARLVSVSVSDGEHKFKLSDKGRQFLVDRNMLV